MDWRQQSSVDYESAFSEAQRWIEAVTQKRFGSSHFRSSLENGVLLCDLINNIKPGIIKKLNRLSTPIAGLDNLNIFLKACGVLGLNQAQLFTPGDLQDLSTRGTVKHQESSRKLKNPLEDYTSLQGSARNVWYSEKEELLLLTGHKREDSLDSLDSLDSRTYSISSDTTLKGSSEGCGSDPEADLSFTMSESKEYRRSLVVTPKTTTQFNQFLPSKDKQSGHVPAPLRKKRVERNDDNRQSWGAPLYTDEDGNFASQVRAGSDPSSVTDLKSLSPHLSRAYDYESTDSDVDRPDPDVVLDDLASRRFHSPTPFAPTNFAIPINPLGAAAIPRTNITVTNVPQQTLTRLSTQSQTYTRPGSAGLCIYDDSEEDDDEFGYADPVQDDLYARKVGLTPHPSANVYFDKFLPKFWTPEEDAHFKKIKLGSQRRPWYRKIQGFSRPRSGSSSDDSDGDVNPWHSLPSFSRTQSDPPPSHSHSPEVHTHSSLTTAASSQTQPLMVAYQSVGLPRIEAPDFWPRPDPTSGPRLLKCEKHPLLGREHPNDPYNVSADILPDLENDDMFTRRTKTFQSSDDLAKLKYGHFLVHRRRPADDVTVVTPRREGEPVYPDIQKDDLVFRRVQQQIHQRPLSGAPDNYHPVPIPEPWTLPPKLQAKLMCAPYEPTQRQPKPETKPGVHLKTDDMLLRKLKALNTQGIANPGASQNVEVTQKGPSCPSSCSEEDLQKWQAIREASRVRYRKRLMVERLLQEASSTDGSQSVSDITEQMNLNNLSRELRFEELRKMREQMKENEEKWQNDLSRWKNKRRSVNSDIVKKKEERDEIDQITSTSNFRRSKTFSEMQDERESRGQSNRNSFNFSSDDVFEAPVPRRRTLQQRSYTVDTPYAPTDKPSAPSVPSLMEEEPAAGTLASEQTDLPTKRDYSSTRHTMNSVQESQTTTQSLLDDPAPVISGSNTSLLKPTSPIKPTESKHSITSTVLNSSQQSKSINSTKPVENSSSSMSFVNKTSSMETKQPGSDQVSAFLPRSYQRSDGSRLTSVVTPRPFGTQANRVTSLPRTFMGEDSQKRMNGEKDSLKKPAVPSRYAQFALEDENLSQGSPVQSSNEEEEEERSAAQTPSPVPPINIVTPLSPPNEEDYSDMRISLNQKPNSSQDFGLQTNWDSTGVRVLSVVPGSPAEHCQVKVGDKVLTVNGHRVADMSYNEWKNSMDEALKQGSLLMDVRRQGGNNWGRDQPSLPFKSHKTINLTSLDPLGSSEKRLNANLDFTSHQKDTIVKTVNVTSQSANLPVPSITTSSTRWSWDQEDERKRQEKWQKEQERLLQEKYKKDQEKLEEEWKEAQKDFALSSKNEKYETEVQEASRLAQEEERKRREQERQHLEEERRKREAQQCLEDERKKIEEEVRLRQEAERKRREEERRQQEEQDKVDTFGYTNAYRELSYSHRSLSKSTPELDEPKPDVKGVYSRHRGLAGWLLEEELRRKNNRQVTASELELERRNIVNAMKYRNPERAGSLSEVGKDYKKEPQSYAEVERQQIIEDMKKKTPLNTDSSWIRQQSLSSNTAKQPVNLAMRRGESLDNLDVPRSSWRSSWAPGSTASIPDYSRPYSALSSSSSNHSGRPGSAAFQTSQSMSSLRQSWSPSTPPSATSPDPESKAPPRNNVLAASLNWGAQKPEPRSEYETNNSIVTPATCDSKLGSPPPCDHTVLHQIEEEAITDQEL
ncbi:LIM domain only protein 7 [Triplophysa tibetana]|uniref:LIM domain only protein 7 n=1 Tax=Triplophysa tibetana TaxID=1572043 RepID=A0A5A9P024_9TELE|nr:LIM domain only protein 7 [Triplophysa tibetana]